MVSAALSFLVPLSSLSLRGAWASPLVRSGVTSVVRDLEDRGDIALPAPLCFPALGFVMPPFLPPDNTHWWCDPSTEYAFVGFSYEVTACESVAYQSEHPVHHSAHRPNPGAVTPRVCRHPLSLQLSVCPTIWGVRQRGLLVSFLWADIRSHRTRLNHAVTISSMPHGITD